MRTLVVVCNLLLYFTAFSQNKSNTFKLFYLGGQSNMDGFGYNKELPDSLNTNFDDVYIFHGNPAIGGELDGGVGIWEQLKPGHGTGFSSDGEKNKLSERFGPELSFAKKMKALFPNDKIAIIKYSRGGTSIDSMANRKPGCWDPDYNGNQGINQYDHFLSTMRNAFKNRDIDNDGMDDLLIPQGIVWMQGEADTDTKEIADRYLSNLIRLMDLIRASLLVDDLKVITLRRPKLAPAQVAGVGAPKFPGADRCRQPAAGGHRQSSVSQPAAGCGVKRCPRRYAPAGSLDATPLRRNRSLRFAF